MNYPKRNRNPPRNVFKIKQPDPQPSQSFIDHGKLDPARSTGALRLQIKALSPLHCGSGHYSINAKNQPIKQIVRRAGQPVLPGSSIKGSIRQIHEALTASCGPFEADPPIKGKPPTLSTRLFGKITQKRNGPSRQGHISFDDAVPMTSREVGSTMLSVPYPPPDKPSGRRFYGTMPEGASAKKKILAEAIPEGRKLESTLRFYNLKEPDLGSILWALGLEHFTPRFGGGKYDYAGWVHVRITGFRLRGGLLDQGTTWVESVTEIEERINQLRSAYEMNAKGIAVFKEFKRRLHGPDVRR